MTAKKNRGRAVKMKTEYTSEEGNKNTVRNATKEKERCFIGKKVKNMIWSSSFRQSVSPRSQEVPNID